MLFQKNILKKYLSPLDSSDVNAAWNTFTTYFHNLDIQQNIRNSKEEQFQEGFLRELFVNVLGYTLNPAPDYNLITEQKNETNSKKADGAIMIDGIVTGVIELKDHKTTDLSKIENQAFGYKAQNKNARYIIISNFEKLRLYIDNAVDFEEFHLFTLDFERFKTLYLALNFQGVKNQTAVKMKSESLSREEQITNLLYKDYSEFKQVLYEDILRWNVDGSSAQLYKYTQKLLDRFLFIFFAEDCGLLPPNTMIKIIDDWHKLQELDEYQPLYNRIKKYFNYLDTGYKGKDFEIFAYNGGLFKPDPLLDSLKISDQILETHTRKLSEYDYESEVDVNILGHIFENSLNDEWNVDGSSVNKRKRDGVFYTPQYITKYIVDNTVGKLCAQQKTALGIVESEYFSDQKRKKETKLQLLEKLDSYRKWLLQITILDPACGSGAFLNAALKFLMAEHRLIDEMEAKITGAAIVMPNIENAILENNLYGVDINDESVEIAKLSLWLRTAKPHRKLNSLNNNIKCGNSLTSDWQLLFPQVFKNGGFDVVIGNPPYVFARERITEVDKNYYVTNYESAKYQINTYILFIELSQKLLKHKGLCGLIVPNAWLMVYSGEDLRKYLIENVTINIIVNLMGKSFEDANVETIIMINRKECATESNQIKVLTNDENSQEFKLTHEIKQSIFSTNKGFEFTVFQDDESSKIIEKIKTNSLELDTAASVKAGLQAYEKGKGNPKQTAEDVKNRPYDYTYKFDDNTYKYLEGSDVLRYGINWSGTWLKYGNHLAAPRTFDLFNGEKIIIREITNEFPKCINATYSDEIYLYNRSNIAVVKRDESFSLKYILTLLNSTLMSYYFKKNTAKAERKLFPKIILNDLRLFPIKNIPLDQQQPFITLADKMLSLRKTLHDKTARFLHRIRETYNLEKITQNLETFYNLDFKAFNTELVKQKIKLTLAQKDELEDYFTAYKTECTALKTEIENTDKEIDWMVYALYNLNDEEIQTITYS